MADGLFIFGCWASGIAAVINAALQWAPDRWLVKPVPDSRKKAFILFVLNVLNFSFCFVKVYGII